MEKRKREIWVIDHHRQSPQQQVNIQNIPTIKLITIAIHVGSIFIVVGPKINIHKAHVVTDTITKYGRKHWLLWIGFVALSRLKKGGEGVKSSQSSLSTSEKHWWGGEGYRDNC